MTLKEVVEEESIWGISFDILDLEMHQGYHLSSDIPFSPLLLLCVCYFSEDPGEDCTELYLPLFPFFGGTYLHPTCYLYSCSPCECEQHEQPLSVVVCISVCCNRYVLRVSVSAAVCVNFFSNVLIHLLYFFFSFKLQSFHHDIHQCMVREMSIINPTGCEYVRAHLLTGTSG